MLSASPNFCEVLPTHETLQLFFLSLKKVDKVMKQSLSLPLPLCVYHKETQNHKTTKTETNIYKLKINKTKIRQINLKHKASK